MSAVVRDEGVVPLHPRECSTCHIMSCTDSVGTALASMPRTVRPGHGWPAAWYRLVHQLVPEICRCGGTHDLDETQ